MPEKKQAPEYTVDATFVNRNYIPNILAKLYDSMDMSVYILFLQFCSDMWITECIVLEFLT